MVRSVLGVVGGLMAAFWVILGITKLGNRFYPAPSTLDFEKIDTVLDAIRNTPTGMLAFLVGSYAVGTFVGAGITARIASEAKITHGMVVGGILLFLNLGQNLNLPYAVWFKVVGALVFLPMAYLGARLVTLAPTPKPVSIEDLE